MRDLLEPMRDLFEPVQNLLEPNMTNIEPGIIKQSENLKNTIWNTWNPFAHDQQTIHLNTPKLNRFRKLNFRQLNFDGSRGDCKTRPK